MTRHPRFFYSARTYWNMGKMPPVAAPDETWVEWCRIRDEEAAS